MCTDDKETVAQFKVMEPEKELTIRIHFDAGQRKPKDAEIFKFFRDHEWKCEELAAMYREDHSVYIKFQSMELMRKALLRLGPKTTFRYADGTETETTVMDAGGILQYVRIFGLTPEIGDDEIKKEMDKYGKVKQSCREKYGTESGYPIWNGVRGVFMEVRKELPPQIKVSGKIARVYYEGLRDKCFGCGSEGHRKVDCPERRSAGTASLSMQRSSFAQVVTNGSSALQPIKALDASSTNNQAGNGQNRSDKQNNEMIKDNTTDAVHREADDAKENSGALDAALSDSGAKNITKIYRRPWPKY